MTAFPLLVMVHALAASVAPAWHIRGITALAIAFVVVGALIQAASKATASRPSALPCPSPRRWRHSASRPV